VRLRWLLLIAVGALLSGCGTTRWSDSARTATEQLLISDAIDRAVSRLDLRAMAGRKVFLDTVFLKSTIDADYIVSSLRQHALASGCIVRTVREEADYVVEIRSGAIGTDRHDVLFGIPATSLPTGTPGVQATVPEMPLVKRTDQRAVAKIALFAYNRQTGRPVWQSGIVPVESSAKDVWVFGAGPFKKGNIHRGMNFAGERLPIPNIEPGNKRDARELGLTSVTAEAYFTEPDEAVEVARRDPPYSSAASTGAPRPTSATQGPTSPTAPAPGPANASGAGSGPAPAGGSNPQPVQSQGNFFSKPAGQVMPNLTLPLQLPQAIGSHLETTK